MTQVFDGLSIWELFWTFVCFPADSNRSAWEARGFTASLSLLGFWIRASCQPLSVVLCWPIYKSVKFVAACTQFCVKYSTVFMQKSPAAKSSKNRILLHNIQTLWLRSLLLMQPIIRPRLFVDTRAVRERENSNSKTLFYKDCSLGSFKNLSNN